MRRKKLYFIPLIMFLLLALALAAGVRHPRDLLAFRLEQIPPFAVAGLSDADLAGKTGVVNFFASWCLPCQAEHPALMQLSKSLPVYGVAFVDEPAALDSFLARLGNPFTVIGRDDDGAAAVAWGVAGIPVSF